VSYQDLNYNAKMEALNYLSTEFDTILLPLKEIGDFDLLGYRMGDSKWFYR
jgi:hypothetical protein